MTRAGLLRDALALGAAAVLLGASLACSEGTDDVEAAAGAGGSGATGGGTGGGAVGSGGSEPSDGWTFDEDGAGWSISFNEGFAGAGGVTGEAMLSWDGTDGDPEDGSLQREAPFTAPDQKVEVSAVLDAPQDLSSSTVTARVRLDSGLATDPGNSGGVEVFVKTGADFVHADGGRFHLEAVSGWITASVNVGTPAGYVADAAAYDPTRVAEIGVEIASGSAETYESATVHIDSVRY